MLNPPTLDALRHDLTSAARSLRRAPAFSTIAVLVLALGIGMATALFSVLNGVLLRPLPIEEQDRVVVLWGENIPRGFGHVPLGLEQAQEFALASRTLQMAGTHDYNGAWPRFVTIDDRGVHLRIAPVSGNLFQVLGVRPTLGRTLAPTDDVVGAAPVAVISHAVWRQHFGTGSDVVGRTIALHGRRTTYTIVGVMPQGLEYPLNTDVWLPIVPYTTPPGADTANAYVDVVGRLAPGATPEAVRAELNAFFQRPDLTGFQRDLSALVHRLHRLVVGDTRPILLAATVAVALLLLIASVNVANLMLIRASSRHREMAVRAALGAGRLRIARQLLAESLPLAVMGGALGLFVAYGALRLLVAQAPVQLPRLEEIALDPATFVAAAAITLVTVLVFGLLPALWTARRDPAPSFRTGGRGGTGTRAGRRTRQGFVVMQVALALLVLIGGGLVTRSLIRLQGLDMGFGDDALLVAELSRPAEHFRDANALTARMERLVDRVAAIPGVVAATPILVTPFSGTGGWDGIFLTEGQSADQASTNPALNMEVVTPSYFRTFDVPLRRGRMLNGGDRRGSTTVVVINESAARVFWPGQDAIGKRLGLATDDPQWLTVVGVVGDTRYRELRTIRPTVFFPVAQSPFPFPPANLALRAEGEPALLVSALREAVRDTDPDVAVASASTMGQLLAQPLAQPRLSVMILTLFGIAALALAAVGVYGVMAAMVRQRMRELGIRVALGAGPRDLVRMVVGTGMLLATSGAGIGLVASSVGTRPLRQLLFEIAPFDAVTVGAVTSLMLGAAAFACYFPARRAAKIDPVAVLRAE